MTIRQPRRLARSTEDDDWSEFNGVAMSEDEFLDLDDREESDLEYIDGIAWTKAVVDANHGDLVGELDFQFGLYRRARGGGFGPERRVRLRTGRYVKPDSACYRAGEPRGDDAIPTVVVEVRSPDETVESQRRKCRLHREAGVPVVWLIEPRRRFVEVFDEHGDAVPLPADGVLSTPHLPGFELKLSQLFAVLDR